MLALISSVLTRKQDQEALQKISSGWHRIKLFNDYVIKKSESDIHVGDFKMVKVLSGCIIMLVTFPNRYSGHHHLKSVANISSLSSTKTVSNIGHQHRCSQN